MVTLCPPQVVATVIGKKSLWLKIMMINQQMERDGIMAWDGRFSEKPELIGALLPPGFQRLRSAEGIIPDAEENIGTSSKVLVSGWLPLSSSVKVR